MNRLLLKIRVVNRLLAARRGAGRTGSAPGRAGWPAIRVAFHRTGVRQLLLAVAALLGCHGTAFGVRHDPTIVYTFFEASYDRPLHGASQNINYFALKVAGVNTFVEG